MGEEGTWKEDMNWDILTYSKIDMRRESVGLTIARSKRRSIGLLARGKNLKEEQNRRKGEKSLHEELLPLNSCAVGVGNTSIKSDWALGA